MPEEQKELKVTISAEDVRTYLQEALVKAIGPSERDKLVTDAVHMLLKGNWQSPSDLQHVFGNAVRDVARELAQEELSKPENMAKVREVLMAGWEKVFREEGRDKLVENVSGAISKAMFGDRY